MPVAESICGGRMHRRRLARSAAPTRGAPWASTSRNVGQSSCWPDGEGGIAKRTGGHVRPLVPLSRGSQAVPERLSTSMRMEDWSSPPRPGQSRSIPEQCARLGPRRVTTDQRRRRFILGGLFFAVRDRTCLASDRARNVSASSVSRNQLLIRRNIEGLGGLACPVRMVMFWATLERRTRAPTVGAAGRPGAPRPLT